MLGFESTEYTLTYLPPICDATLPYSFSPATTATVLGPLAAAGVDDTTNPEAISIAPSPSTAAATFADLHIALRSPVASSAPPTRSFPTRCTSMTEHGTVSRLSGSVSDNGTLYLE